GAPQLPTPTHPPRGAQTRSARDAPAGAVAPLRVDVQQGKGSTRRRRSVPRARVAGTAVATSQRRIASGHRELSPDWERRNVTDRAVFRLAGALLAGGFVTNLIATHFHPSGHEDNFPVVFAKYAESGSWTAVHLVQFVGVLIVLGGFL